MLGVGRRMGGEPGGSAALMGEGDAAEEGGVFEVGFFDAPAAVALGRAMQEDDMARQPFGASLGDALGGEEGFAVGEVSLAAHDARFEEVGAGAGELKLRIVVGFDRQDVNGGKAFDELIGDAAEVGGVTDAGVVGFEEESAGAFVIVGKQDWGDRQAVRQLEGLLIEDAQEVGGFEGPARGVIPEVVHVPSVEEQGDAVGEHHAGPGGSEVVLIEVGDADGLEVFDREADLGHAVGDGPRREAGVDKARGLSIVNHRRVSA